MVEVQYAAPGSFVIRVIVTDVEDQKATHSLTLLVEGKDPEQLKQEQFEKLMKQGYAHENEPNLSSAIEKYREALKLIEDARLRRHMQEIQAKLKADAEKVRVLMEEAQKEADAERFGPAITRAREVLELDPKHSKAPRLIAEWQKLEKTLQRHQELVQKGYAREKAADWAEAVKIYREVLALRPDPKLAAHIRELDEKRKANAQAKKRNQ